MHTRPPEAQILVQIVQNRNKRPRNLDALLCHLPDTNKLGLCLRYNHVHVVATYVAGVTHICATNAHES